jgi:hypothetical protein
MRFACHIGWHTWAENGRREILVNQEDRTCALAHVTFQCKVCAVDKVMSVTLAHLWDETGSHIGAPSGEIDPGYSSYWYATTFYRCRRCEKEYYSVHPS